MKFYQVVVPRDVLILAIKAGFVTTLPRASGAVMLRKAYFWGELLPVETCAWNLQRGSSGSLNQASSLFHAAAWILQPISAARDDASSDTSALVLLCWHLCWLWLVAGIPGLAYFSFTAVPEVHIPGPLPAVPRWIGLIRLW